MFAKMSNSCGKFCAGGLNIWNARRRQERLAPGRTQRDISYRLITDADTRIAAVVEGRRPRPPC